MSAPLCINCISGDVLPGEPKGRLEKVGPYHTYISRPSNTPDAGSQGKVIVSFTDLFGLELKNAKIYADMLADKTGLIVYTPDLFHGAPVASTSVRMPQSSKEAESQGLLTKVTNGLKVVSLLPWIYRNWPSKKYEECQNYLQALREEKDAKRIGAVGFCYGGKFVLYFNQKGSTDVSVANHPSFLGLGDFDNLKGPILFNCAQTDETFTDKLREDSQKKLDADPNAPPHEYVVYENCHHGFTARPNLGDELVKKGFEVSFDRAAEWFKCHL